MDRRPRESPLLYIPQSQHICTYRDRRPQGSPVGTLYSTFLQDPSKGYGLIFDKEEAGDLFHHSLDESVYAPYIITMLLLMTPITRTRPHTHARYVYLLPLYERGRERVGGFVCFNLAP